MTEIAHTNLAQILTARAAIDDGRRDAFVFRRGFVDEATVSDRDLLERAQRIAAAFRKHGINKGDHVLIMLTSQSDFIDVFFGAAWADVVPVPLCPPMFTRRPADFLANYGEIVASSGARVLVASDEIIAMMNGFADNIGGGFRVFAHPGCE